MIELGRNLRISTQISILDIFIDGLGLNSKHQYSAIGFRGYTYLYEMLVSISSTYFIF